MRITNNERTPKILGKFKLSLILALVVILPLSAVVLSVSKNTNSTFGTQKNNLEAFNRVRLDFFDYLLNKIDDDVANTKLQRQHDNSDLTRAEELRYHTNKFVEGILTDREYDIFSKLTEDELELLASVFDEFGSDSVVDKTQARWWGTEFRFKLHFTVSVGWFVGNLSTTLITMALVGIIAKIVTLSVLQGAVLGAIIGTIVGAIIGGLLMNTIDRLISRLGKADVSWVLVEYSQWWPWNWDVDLNIADLFFELINFGGGGFISGAFSSIPKGYNAMCWA